MRRRTWRGAAGAAVGAIAAIVVVEVCLVPLASAHTPPLPDIAADSLGGPVFVSRQVEEGIATARFSVGGSRLTGRAPLATAPVVVLLGDSYVVAREVPDASTMGAGIERLAAADQ